MDGNIYPLYVHALPDFQLGIERKEEGAEVIVNWVK